MLFRSGEEVERGVGRSGRGEGVESRGDWSGDNDVVGEEDAEVARREGVRMCLIRLGGVCRYGGRGRGVPNSGGD
mgnify:FL=1